MAKKSALPLGALFAPYSFGFLFLPAISGFFISFTEWRILGDPV